MILSNDHPCAQHFFVICSKRFDELITGYQMQVTGQAGIIVGIGCIEKYLLVPDDIFKTVFPEA